MFCAFANNPIKYKDPDGRSLVKIRNDFLADVFTLLYEKSPTFKKHVDKIMVPKNNNNQYLLVFISGTTNGKYAGNTETNDSDLTENFNIVQIGNDGKISNSVIKAGTKNAQIIFITIDLKRIRENKLNIYEVMAEEIAHASNILDFKDAEKWNEYARKDNLLPYNEREREIHAKSEAKKILEEFYSDK